MLEVSAVRWSIMKSSPDLAPAMKLTFLARERLALYVEELKRGLLDCLVDVL